MISLSYAKIKGVTLRPAHLIEIIVLTDAGQTICLILHYGILLF